MAEETICKKCGNNLDISELDPFTALKCNECDSEVIVPLILGDIRLEKYLGEKPPFEIYDGYDVTSQINSVFYILNCETDSFEEIRKKACDETNSISLLEHKNICPILNIGDAEEHFYVSEPHMDGFILADYSPHHGQKLDIDRLLSILLSITLGLGYAHNQGVSHHNICPETIQIDGRWNVRIKCFFSSNVSYKINNETKDFRLFMISPYFISPEKVEFGVEDGHGDIFSLGVIFYFLLTGKYPFNGKNEDEIVFSRIKEVKSTSKKQEFSNQEKRVKTVKYNYVKPIPPHEIRNDIPPKISHMIMGMLSYYPTHRPKLSDIIQEINFFKMKKEMKKLDSLKRKMFTSTAKSIPSMKNLFKTKK